MVTKKTILINTENIFADPVSILLEYTTAYDGAKRIHVSSIDCDCDTLGEFEEAVEKNLESFWFTSMDLSDFKKLRDAFDELIDFAEDDEE